MGGAENTMCKLFFQHRSKNGRHTRLTLFLSCGAYNQEQKITNLKNGKKLSINEKQHTLTKHTLEHGYYQNCIEIFQSHRQPVNLAENAYKHADDNNVSLETSELTLSLQ